jgi:transposase-like protein
MPAACGNGHPLSAENLRIEDGEARWRCRQCGRERAAASRGRRETAA